jgi:hypothetical protein
VPNSDNQLACLMRSTFWLNSKFHWDFHKNIREIERWKIIVEKFDLYQKNTVSHDASQFILNTTPSLDWVGCAG